MSTKIIINQKKKKIIENYKKEKEKKQKQKKKKIEKLKIMK